MTADLLRRRAARSPHDVAVETAEGRWSYRELDRAADRVAEGLRAASLERPAIVVTFLPATPAGIAAVHGVPRARAVLASAGLGWTAEELALRLGAIRPSALLLPDDPERHDAPAAAGEPVGGPAGRVLAAAGFRLYRMEGAPRQPPTELPREVHTLLWTSGTAGRPRAVPLTLANHLAVARGATRRLGLGPADRWLASLALSHVGGIALVLRAAYTGARLVLPTHRFRAGELQRLAVEGRISHASLVPTMLYRLLEEMDGAPPGLRCLLVGGAATPPALLESAVGAGLPVALTYGLTEAASQVATAPPALVRRKPGVAGRPLAGVGLRVVDGEIRVRGRSVMPGYLSERGDPFDAAGWLRTGDAGTIDPDGHLRVTGRLTDRIVTGGVNVDPAEVEAALDGAPGLVELAVTAVQDPVWGERLVAVVVCGRAGGLDVEALDRLARSRLSGPRRPRAWIPVENLPRNANGKVDRAALRRLAARRLSEHPPRESDEATARC